MLFEKKISWYTGRIGHFRRNNGQSIENESIEAYVGKSTKKSIIVLEVGKTDGGRKRREFFMNVYDGNIEIFFDEYTRAESETYSRKHRIAARDLEKTILGALED